MESLSFKLLCTHHLLKTNKQIFDSRKSFQNDAGFSLVEMIAVVLMIGVLAMIAIPSWLGFLKQQRINKANNAVFAAIQEAQQEAKKRKQSYSVSFKVENNIPKIAVHPDSTQASALTQNQWEQKKLEESLGIKAEQVTLLTNLTAKNTAGTAVNSQPSYLNTPQTITFDYMGTLPDSNFGIPPTGSTEPPGLKIVVAGSVSGSSTSTSGIKRCVIVKSLLGSIVTGKGQECN